jgi:hypothetical protein
LIPRDEGVTADEAIAFVREHGVDRFRKGARPASQQHIIGHIRSEENFVGQVTIYLDDETEKRAREAAESDGVSLSKWVAKRIHKGVGTEWPAAVRELAGAWPDLPSAEEVRQSPRKDIARRRL